MGIPFLNQSEHTTIRGDMSGPWETFRFLPMRKWLLKSSFNKIKNKMLVIKASDVRYEDFVYST